MEQEKEGEREMYACMHTCVCICQCRLCVHTVYDGVDVGRIDMTERYE